MLLDFNPGKRTFTLTVPRGSDIQGLMREHGLDFSEPASTEKEAVLYTREPYAAVTFFDFASDRAKAQLLPIHEEIERSWAVSCERTFRVPEGRVLWPFQVADVEYALSRKNTLIGDEPGLGKTPTAITFCNEVKAKSVLVICQANLRLQWVKRIQEWTTLPYRGQIHAITDGSKGTHPTAIWTILSYDLCWRPTIWGEIVRRNYDVLILDEPHCLKNSGSNRSRAIFGGGRSHDFVPISSRAERILALTGTPLPNRPREAYVLARGLNFDSIDFMSEDAFQTRFNPSRTRQVTKTNGQSVLVTQEAVGRQFELQARLRANFMVRHLKHGPDGVMKHLKTPRIDLIRVEENKAIREALAAENMLHIDPENWSGADMKVMGQIGTVRRLMGVAIAPQVADFAKLAMESGEDKLVIFAWHIEVLDILETKLEKYKPVRIDGRDNAVSKQRKVDQFVEDPRRQIIIGNLLSMGTGTDGLQKVCNHLLLAEPDWVPGNNQQAIDRLDRGVQEGSVQADLFVVPNSVGEKILASSLRKCVNIHKTLDVRL